MQWQHATAAEDTLRVLATVGFTALQFNAGKKQFVTSRKAAVHCSEPRPTKCSRSLGKLTPAMLVTPEAPSGRFDVAARTEPHDLLTEYPAHHVPDLFRLFVGDALVVLGMPV